MDQQAGVGMKPIFVLLCLSALAPVAAQACSPIEVTTTSITRGDACEVGYSSPDLVIGSGPATRLSERIVRQFVTKGACAGEQIVFYYDCAQGHGVWLGGDYSAMGAFSPEPQRLTPDTPIVMSAGPANYVADTVEPQFAPAYSIDAIWQKAQTLNWIPQKGQIASPAVTVEGKGFNLACGCRLKAAP